MKELRLRELRDLSKVTCKVYAGRANLNPDLPTLDLFPLAQACLATMSITSESPQAWLSVRERPCLHQEERTGLSLQMGRLQLLRADRQFLPYLQCLLQSGDVFTADFHVVQSYLRDEGGRKNVISG